MDPAPQTLNNFFPHQKTVVFDLENVVTKKAITRTYEERLDNSNCTGVTLREIISLCASQRLPSVLVLARSSNNKTYRCFTYDSFHRENNWNFKSFFYYTATPLSNGLRVDYCGQFEKKPTGIITYQEKSSQDQIFLLNQIFRVMQEKTPYSKYRLSNAYERLNYPLHASHWLQIAALENYPNAHYRIFLRSLKIKPLKIDLVSLQKAAFGGHKNAQFEYARYLYKNDPKKAFEFCLKAGRQGHVGAQIRLWKCYSGYRRIVQKDATEAHKWLTAAALNGHSFAKEQVNSSTNNERAVSFYSLSQPKRKYLINSITVNRVKIYDKKEINLMLLKLAALNGHLEACFEYALAMQKKKILEAVPFFQKVPFKQEAKECLAIFNQESSLLKRKQIETNSSQLSEKSIELHRLFGKSFLEEKNEQKGEYHLLTAAYAGDKSAQRNLGFFYLKKCATEGLVKAAFWFKCSLLQHNCVHCKIGIDRIFDSKNEYPAEILTNVTEVLNILDHTFSQFAKEDFNKAIHLAGKEVEEKGLFK